MSSKRRSAAGARNSLARGSHDSPVCTPARLPLLRLLFCSERRRRLTRAHLVQTRYSLRNPGRPPPPPVFSLPCACCPSRCPLFSSWPSASPVICGLNQPSARNASAYSALSSAFSALQLGWTPSREPL